MLGRQRPRSARPFQVLRFGRWLNPRSVEDNPARMQIIVEEAAKVIPDLPEEVKDVLNWTVMYADEETGTFVIEWESP